MLCYSFYRHAPLLSSRQLRLLQEYKSNMSAMIANMQKLQLWSSSFLFLHLGSLSCLETKIHHNVLFSPLYSQSFTHESRFLCSFQPNTPSFSFNSPASLPAQTLQHPKTFTVLFLSYLLLHVSISTSQTFSSSISHLFPSKIVKSTLCTFSFHFSNLLHSMLPAFSYIQFPPTKIYPLLWH